MSSIGTSRGTGFKLSNHKIFARCTKGVAVFFAAGVLASCAQRELILPGERLDLRAPLDTGVKTGEDAAKGGAADASPENSNRALPIKLPAQVNHTEWPQRYGNSMHRVVHPAFSASPVHLWAASIGSGESRKYRITADPVVADGRIFTLDSRSTVMAHSAGGDSLWSADVTPASDKTGDASGGGLAVAGDTLFVTSGFGQLVALDVKTGKQRWVQKLDSSATGAPAVRDGLVYVVSRDNRAWAIEAKNGRIRWELPSVPAEAVMINGAAPAVTEKFVIFPFGNGELTAAFRKGGVRIWRTPVAGHRRGRVYASIRDITGDPVVVGDVVYAGNAAGRVVALKLGSGERIWTADEGTYSPVWPTGGSVFLVSDQDELVRLDSATGEKIWSVQMPYFTKEKPKKWKTITAHYGPVLAGGRLIVASSDGLIRAFDPTDGSLMATYDLPGGATTNPVIVNGTLYVVSTKGQLHAFR